MSVGFGTNTVLILFNDCLLLVKAFNNSSVHVILSADALPPMFCSPSERRLQTASDSRWPWPLSG